MKNEWKVFIRGVNGRGSEIIEMLVALGAKNKGICEHHKGEFIYFINYNGCVDLIDSDCELGRIIIDNYSEIKLPELWKDGDILVDNDDPNRFVVKRNIWNDSIFKAYLFVNQKHVHESPIVTFCDKNYHKADSKEVRRFHEILHKYGKDWDAENKQLVDWEWKPKRNNRYWMINSDGSVNSYLWYDDSEDKGLFNFGNCFQTKEEAVIMSNKIKKLLNAKSYEDKEIRHIR